LKQIIKKPLQIGLTGGIGSGKTTISNIFKYLGVPVFNSDNISKELIRTNQHVIQTIIKEFDKSIIQDDIINTKLLAKIVFSNKHKLKILNSIIHPHVLQKFDNWVLKQNAKYIIKESAILFESNTYQKLNKIILVKSPLEMRIKRVCKRDDRTEIDVERIINNQIGEDEYIQHVDYVINNDKELLLPNIIRLNKTLSDL
jgi:dephospho-CoA kinase